MNKTQLCSQRLWVRDTCKYCESNYIINVTRWVLSQEEVCFKERPNGKIRFVLSGRTACGMEPGGGKASEAKWGRLQGGEDEWAGLVRVGEHFPGGGAGKRARSTRKKMGRLQAAKNLPPNSEVSCQAEAL